MIITNDIFGIAKTSKGKAEIRFFSFLQSLFRGLIGLLTAIQRLTCKCLLQECFLRAPILLFRQKRTGAYSLHSAYKQPIGFSSSIDVEADQITVTIEPIDRSCSNAIGIVDG